MSKSQIRKHKVHKIALTGGPGGGKTTAAELFKREYKDLISVVPEAATLLFTGGFPRMNIPSVIEALQSSIYNVQVNMENVYATVCPHHTLLCDRGTVDGGAYWPGGHEEFFKKIGSSLEKELSRYDAVIFFETAAAGGFTIELGNPMRNEDQRQAIELDQKLKQLWNKHPNFVYIQNEPSFLQKTLNGIKAMDELIKKFPPA